MTRVVSFLKAPSTVSKMHLAIDFSILNVIVFSMLGFKEFRSAGATFWTLLRSWNPTLFNSDQGNVFGWSDSS